ncbi:hypothetical protein [Ferribacterium limneticum]|uniref:hypothetical protein n=1 Tax=Ferribacterium limneticum TaxID=76259 RepID=UPI001CFAF0C8|nr:hypothetical protein [Ferribacterium limneticum]UCV27662.1 hypothetical protein KI617_15560 [Ferribacterium limneticum]UCV31579.1 hypothetical protein KI608_15560 [Ferribacterium limneticum]
MKVGFVPLAVLSAVLALSGCSSTSGGGTPLIPDKAIQLTAGTAVSMSTLVAAAALGAVAYVVYDPLAPNWEIEESRLNDSTYRFSMKMKRYHTGGAGESIQILKRRASQLQYEQGFGSYQIMEYSEGIDSQTIGARRVAEGTIRLVQRQQADSFLQN